VAPHPAALEDIVDVAAVVFFAAAALVLHAGGAAEMLMLPRVCRCALRLGETVDRPRTQEGEVVESSTV
jgi:hypothetical protein